MHSRKNYALLFLALTTVVGAAVAWHEYQELIALRAAALDSEASWLKRLQNATHQRADLAAQVAGLKKKVDDEKDAADDPAPEPGAFARRNGRFAFREMMQRPEMQKLLALREKAALDTRYGALFKNLALTPEQLDKFKDLLVEKRTSMMDVMAAARDQGIDPRSDPEAFQKLVADAQAQIDASIQSTLGPDDYAQYQNYEQTMPQRNVVDQLTQRLSYTSTPLSDQQAEQMVQILAANAPPRPNPSGASGTAAPAGGLAAAFGGGTTRINEADISQAAGVLAAPQIQALQQIQQEQAAQAQLRAAMRAQFQAQAPAAPAAQSGGGG